jgi:hypothetical protein
MCMSKPHSPYGIDDKLIENFGRRMQNKAATWAICANRKVILRNNVQIKLSLCTPRRHMEDLMYNSNQS